MSSLPSEYYVRRSVPFTLINTVGNGLRALGLQWPRLDAGHLFRKARERTGIELELPAVREHLDRLLQSLEQEARPNTFGRLAAQNFISRMLAGRLRMEDHLRRHPEITEREEIRKPVFIIGLPRTGTTILHALLAQDPANRSPRCWECLEPYPVPRPETYETDPRIEQVRSEFDQFFKLIPDFQKMHHMGATTPQECISIHALDLQSYQFLAQYNLPSYLEWLNTKDMDDQYRFHKRVLQYLQSGGVRGERWLLKTPVHLPYLKNLFRVYPDAQIIMTHRHPYKIVASVSSLMSSVRSVYTDHPDVAATAREQLEMWSSYLNRFVAQRDQHTGKEKQFCDLFFGDFIRDPIAAVKQVYDHFGWTLSKEALSRMQQYMADNPRDKHGRHTYTLDQFGISREEVAAHYKTYIDYLEMEGIAE